MKTFVFYLKCLILIIVIIVFLNYYLLPQRPLSNNLNPYLKEKKYVTTIEHRGRLGNMLFRCASLYGIAKQLDRFPYISSLTIPEVSVNEIAEMFPLFQDYFEIKTIPFSQESVVSFGEDCCKYESPSILEKYRNIKYLKLTGLYLQSFKYFVNYQHEIKNLMECSNNLKALAKLEADRMWKDDLNSHKFCIHIRRTDFLNNTDLQETSSEFLLPATTLIYKKLKRLTPNISLLFIGDDEAFIENLKLNIQFTSINSIPKNISSRFFDMCFAIEYCETFLISASSSSYGWWIGFLKKGKGNVYYNSDISRAENFSKNIYATDLFPLHWIKLKKLRNGNVSEQTVVDVRGMVP